MDDRIFKPLKSKRELYIDVMWLMFMRAPGRETAPGEPVDLGEIGSVTEKDWERQTPYSPAQPIALSGMRFDNGPRIGFVNDLEQPEAAPEWWQWADSGKY